jgi:hypothetical protein
MGVVLARENDVFTFVVHKTPKLTVPAETPLIEHGDFAISGCQLYPGYVEAT